MTPDPAARRPLKSRELVFFRKLATRFTAAGVSPNAISASSIVFGAVAGLALAATAQTAGAAMIACYLGAAAGIQLRLAANLLDGMVAVEGGRSGPTGELWNEAPDRIADASILIGAGCAAGGNPQLGLGAALMAVFVAYVRALGASVGAGQCFFGPQAKPHRMAVITGACIVSAVGAGLPAPPAWLPHVLGLALWIVILGGAITAWRRLRFIAAFLRARHH